MKYFFIISLNCLLLNVANADNKTLLIKDKNNSGVNERQLKFYLKSQGNEAYKKVLKDKLTVEKVLEQMYLTTAVANEVRASELWKDENSDLRLEVQILVDKFLQLQKVKEIANKPLPDFEKLAKQRFEAHRADYKEPEKIHAGHILINVDRKTTKQQALVEKQLSSKP